MNPRPIIVLGTGRSGTSTAARILHTRLNVCMGHKFHPGDIGNLLGYYEEMTLEPVARELARGCNTAAVWMERLAYTHRHCDAELIGYKHPIMSTVSNTDMHIINPLFVVKCWRPQKMIMASIKTRKKPYSPRMIAQRKEMQNTRLAGMEKGLVNLPVITIDYTNRLTDDEVYEILAPHVSKWR